MKPKLPPSHRGIAAATGLSVATVSLALRRHPRIPEVTRLRVEKAAEELGYHTNGAIQEVMAQIRRARPVEIHAALGGVLAFNSHAWDRSWFMQRLIAAASRRAEERGYQLDLFRLNEPDFTPQRIEQILVNRGIRGLVVLPFETIAGQGPVMNLGDIDFEWSLFAVAKIGFTTQEPRFHVAVNHQRHTVELACRRLSAMGYERVGLATPEVNDHAVDHSWSAGFRLFQESVRRPHRVAPFLPGWSRWRKTHFLRWIEQHRPDVVVANHHEPYQWLREEGFNVPEQIAYLRLDRDPVRPVACVDQHNEEVAAAAVDLVIDQLHRGELGIPKIQRVVMIEGGWIGGPTVREESEVA